MAEHDICTKVRLYAVILAFINCIFIVLPFYMKDLQKIYSFVQGSCRKLTVILL